MTSLEQRIASLERTVARQRRISLALAAIFATTLTAAAVVQDPVPEVLRAKRIELVEAPDKPPAIVLSAESSEGRIDLFARAAGEEPQVRLDATQSGRGLVLLRATDDSSLRITGQFLWGMKQKRTCFKLMNGPNGTFLAGASGVSNTLIGLLDTLAAGRRVQPILEEEPESARPSPIPVSSKGASAPST